MKFKIILISFITLLLVLNGCGYNSMVSKDEEVNQAWSQVENQYQRRADLIPNLVSTVQGYADFEKSTIEEVTKYRSQVGQMKLTMDDLNDPDKFAAFQKAQDGLSNALSRLLVVSENYPNLKANENFMALQTQLEGTENRIAVARKKFNEVVQEYNTYIRSFPNVVYAGWFGFKEKQYFKSQEGSDKAPKIEFNKK